MTDPQKPARVVYRATGPRRLTLSIMMLLLIPFVASVPIMLWQRISQGVWLGTAGLIVLGTGLTAILLLIAINLMQALRSRVVLGDEAVEMTLPAGRGPTPLVRYASNKVRYDQIRAVETRSEIYGGTLAPVLLTGARVITKDGDAIRLGYINAYNEDPHMPVIDIARQIAQRAGIEVMDRGAVHRSAAGKALGSTKLGFIGGTSSTQPVAAEEFAAINSRHRLFSYALGGVLAIILVLGIFVDFRDPFPGAKSAVASKASEKAPAKPPQQSKK